MSMREAAIAANRFGLGPKPGELERVAGSPRKWLLDQTAGTRPTPAAFDGFMTGQQIWANYTYRYVRHIPILEEQKRAKAAGDQQRYDELAAAYNRILYGWVTWCKETNVLECGARSNVALMTDEPFRERLLHFWSNHLVVPNGKQSTQIMLGAYEREAIRPHVTGKFADMLMASIKHPAMIDFLDNHLSVGPNSVYGQSSGNGLNENLAREILELHTLGVEGGYTQNDVIELAKAISGWSIYPTQLDEARQRELAAKPGFEWGQQHFYEDWHEPGPRKLLGKTYDQEGEAQGEAMLNDLARHPNTARFLATKFARHFVADDPPEDLVRRLADVYLESDTDLGEMTRALIESNGPWEAYGEKVKQPIDYAYSVMRSLGLTLGEGKVPPQAAYVYEDYPMEDGLWVWYFTDSFGLIKDRAAVRQALSTKKQTAGYDVLNLMRALASMGQPLQVAPGPQGWYDRASDWSGADSIMKRVEWALALAYRESNRVMDPRTFLDTVLGDLAGPELRLAVARAASPEQGLGLVLASPEFQRR